MDRKTALLGVGTLALAACSGGLGTVPAAGSKNINSQLGKTIPRQPMALPPGYSTTTSTSANLHTTTLFYNGAAIAQLTLDTNTWQTTFADLTTNRSWTSTSPVGTAKVGEWNLAPNATATYQSETYINVTTPSGNGYFYSAVSSSTGNYYTGMNHPLYWSSEQDIDSGIAASTNTGSGCTTHVCPQVTFACAKAIAMAGLGALGMAAAVASMLTGALTPLAIAGFIGAHIAFIQGIADVFAECL